MRRGTLTLLATAGLALVPASAEAAKLETWLTTSRYVDPATVRFNGPADRPKRLRVNVLLPDGYDGRRQFPLLVLLHGHGDAYDTWAKPANGDIARIADGLGAVIVMPEGARGWYVNWWNGGRRGAPGWERYHLDELLPLVERRLRIRPERRWHAIAGLSMGGEGTMFYASQRPGYFGSAAAFSPPLSLQRPEWPTAFDTQGEDHQDVFGDPQNQRFYWQGHNPTALVGNLRETRLFVAVGNGVPTLGELGNPVGALAEADLAQHAADFVRAARAAGADVTYRPQPGIHDWPYWRRHFGQAREWGLFKAVAESPARWDYATVAREGEMWDLGYRFGAAPETVESFSRRGETLSASGAGDVTITTAEGCRFDAVLPFSRKLPSGCTLKLRVRPRRAVAGRLTRFRFRVWVVRDGVRVPVRRVRIRFAGKRKRTNRRGRTSMVLRLRKTGERRVRAKRAELVGARAVVRVR